MAFTGGERIILYVIIAALIAIIYSLRILVLMERRIARVDANIEKMALKIGKEEVKIEGMIKRRG